MGSLMEMSEYYGSAYDAPLESEYDEEILCSGWNPAMRLAQYQPTFAGSGKETSMPIDLAMVDAEQFMHDIYEGME